MKDNEPVETAGTNVGQNVDFTVKIKVIFRPWTYKKGIIIILAEMVTSSDNSKFFLPGDPPQK
jgi:hypothetical protein